MRYYKEIVQEAELLAAPPEVVAEFLRKRAGQSKTEAQNDTVTEDVENALRSRAHPLIDLSLAGYGRYYSTICPLFECAPLGHAVRLAILSNTSVGSVSLNHFPLAGAFSRGLFRDDQEAVRWLEQAIPEEVQALFENPTLADSFLRDVLERSTPWNEITDETFRRVVGALVGNVRLRTPRNENFADGWAEHEYNSIFDAAWKLAELVEPTQDWAIVLGHLYEQMVPVAFSLTEPLSLVTRWQSGPSDAEEGKGQVDFSWKQRVRIGLGRLALCKNSDLFPALLNNGDLALRCAAYATGKLTPDQFTAAFEKEGEIVFEEAINNPWLWRSAPTRATLKSMASSIDRDHNRWLEGHFYNRMHEDMQRKHPDWFKDEEYDEKGQDDDDPSLPDNLEYTVDVEERKAGKRWGRILMWSFGIACALVLVTDLSHWLFGFPSDTKRAAIVIIAAAAVAIASASWTLVLQSRALRLKEFRNRFRQIDRRLMKIESTIKSGRVCSHRRVTQ